MIQLISVTKQYGDEIIALEDVSLEIQNGEFVFLTGASGSGKTTLIKMLIRDEVPSYGKIYFEDDDITRYKRKQVYQLRRKIGVIFQDYKLIPELTAAENIAFAMEAAGKTDKEINENVPYLLDIVGLTKRMHSFPMQLSGGEKQRVAIARAIANNPKLLIADEPTGNLDPDSAWDIVQILSKINNWGTTVLMSTHGSDIVNSLHKRVLKMEDGKLIRDDFKGGYDDADEFSLKVLEASNSKIEEKKEKAKERIETKTKNIKPPDHKESETKTLTEKRKAKGEVAQKSEEPEVKAETQTPKKTETKKKTTKKIKFSTKKSDEQKQQDEKLEEEILKKIDDVEDNSKKDSKSETNNQKDSDTSNQESSEESN